MTNKKAISVLFLPLSLVVIVVRGEAFNRTNSVIDLKMEFFLKFLKFYSKLIQKQLILRKLKSYKTLIT
jgi:hypothetical protein